MTKCLGFPKNKKTHFETVFQKQTWIKETVFKIFENEILFQN
jgi:hypothetical protein